MGENKRKYPRIAINTFIRFYEESFGGDEQRHLQGVAKNYSDGGIFISTKHLLPKGCVVTVEIPVESESQNLKIIQVRGVVRWVGHSPGFQGIGIEFLEFKEAGFKDFLEWMATLVE